MGVILDPSPEILAGLLHGEFGLPVEFLVGQSRVGGKIQDIPLSTSDNLILQVASDNGTESLDHLEYGAAAARAKVPGLDARLFFAQVVESDKVASSEVEDVDVIADGGAVGRLVV